MKKGRGKVWLSVTVMVILIASVCMTGICHCMASANSWKIECADFNAPTLKVYLYGADKWDAITFTHATLTTQTGEVRDLAYKGGKLMTDTGEGTEYIYLVDITASMKAENIEMVRQEILEHLEELSGEDRMIVYVFGGNVKQIVDIKGSQKDRKKDRKAVNSRLQKGMADGRGSAVYHAMEKIMDDTAAQSAGDKKHIPVRKVCLLLTDGKDRDFGAMDRATFEQKLQESHTAFYGIGMSGAAASGSKQPVAGDNYEQLESYCSVSGGDWTYEPGDSKRVYRTVKQKRQQLANCFAAEFEAENNRVSNAQEVVAVTSADNRSSTRTILANRYQEDHDVPKAEDIKKAADNAVSFRFSEAVDGADEKQNFSIKNGSGRAVPIRSVSYDSNSHKCEIICEEDLYSGKYTIRFHNITDQSMEQNKAKGTKFDLTGRSRLAGNVMYVLLHFWWLFATAAILAAAAVIYKKLSEQGGVVIWDGKASLKGQLKITEEPKLDISGIKNLYMDLLDADRKTREICIQIDKGICVGSNKICNIIIKDRTLSKQHFVIENVGGKARITDLHSLNGTFVNDRRIEKDCFLRENDVIRAGKQTFVFHGIR